LDSQQADWLWSGVLGVPPRIRRHFLALQLQTHYSCEVLENVIRKLVSFEAFKEGKGPGDSVKVKWLSSIVLVKYVLMVVYTS